MAKTFEVKSELLLHNFVPPKEGSRKYEHVIQEHVAQEKKTGIAYYTNVYNTAILLCLQFNIALVLEHIVTAYMILRKHASLIIALLAMLPQHWYATLSFVYNIVQKIYYRLQGFTGKHVSISCLRLNTYHMLADSRVFAMMCS